MSNKNSKKRAKIYHTHERLDDTPDYNIVKSRTALNNPTGRLAATPRSPLKTSSSKTSHWDSLLEGEDTNLGLLEDDVMYPADQGTGEEGNGEEVMLPPPPPPASTVRVPKVKKRVHWTQTHRDWKDQKREEYLQEIIRHDGRGEWGSASGCPDCHVRGEHGISAQYRCRECFLDDLVCKGCCLRRHKQHPLHIIEEWTGTFFRRVTLQELGLVIQLNHGYSPCALPERAHEHFVVLHTNGLHPVTVNYCNCTRAIPHHLQLLRRGWYPSTPKRPRTAATFRYLEHLEIISLTSKVGVYDCWRACEKLTDNSGRRNIKSRYVELMRMLLQWRHLRLLKRGGRGHDDSGVNGTKPGELALPCPSCPHPGINLPEDWSTAGPEWQFLYALIVCLDANFRLKNQLRSSYALDPGLGTGWAYFVPSEEYFAYVLSCASDQDISTCVGFAALTMANTRFSKGLRYTGVGACSCARSEMILGNGVGDLQLGERYANMDFIFLCAVIPLIFQLLFLIVSYDIACQWFVKLFLRMPHLPERLRLPEHIQVRAAIPKLHFRSHEDRNHAQHCLHWMHGAGQCDCEGPERIWAGHNALGNSTKSQGPGTRHDNLDFHFAFWNWLKYVGMGPTLRKKHLNAIVERNKHIEAHRGFTATLDPALVSEWEKIADDWDRDFQYPKRALNPFEVVGDEITEARVLKELGEEEEERQLGGAYPLNETTPAGFIYLGLEIEAYMRRVKTDVKAKATHSNSSQATISERRNTLRSKLKKFQQLQAIYMPGLLQFVINRQRSAPTPAPNDNTPRMHVEDAELWLPSMVPTAVRDRVCLRLEDSPQGLPGIEQRLREAQCTSALNQLRSALRLKSHMTDWRNANARGQREGLRSRVQIDRIERDISSSSAKYRAARLGLINLSNEASVSTQFPILHDNDIASYADPDLEANRKRKRTVVAETAEELEENVDDLQEDRRRPAGESRRVISWIWRHRGLSSLTGDASNDRQTDDILRAEWIKSRARAKRWSEEVHLLREEMRRVLAFLRWKSLWWKERVHKRTNVCDPILMEGLQAYAHRQAALQHDLATLFQAKWTASLQEGIQELLAELQGQGGDEEREEEEEEGEEGEEEGEEEDGDDDDDDNF